METWDGDHLSELALSCLADGQDVIDPVARVHAESCAVCAMRIGAMAVESHEVGAALKVARELSPREAPRQAFPTVLVAAAATVAVVCGAPSVMDGFPRIVAWIFAAPRILPVITTTATAVSKSFSSSAVSLVATFTLALFGLAVARASSKNQGATS